MRRFILMYFVSFVLLTFPQQYKCQCSMTDATAACIDQLVENVALDEPDQLGSAGNSWSIDLVVDVAKTSYNWLELSRRMYNGKITGPTWKVKRGDALSVNLDNRLSAEGNDLGNALNQQNYPNTTNLHTHGLHISSVDPQDNVLRHVNPGTQYTYEYRIHENNPPGTYWYHAHVHGSTMFQVHGGLSGMIIVEDAIDEMSEELKLASCPSNCDKDIQMLFQPILQYSGNRGFGALQDAISDFSGFRHDQYTLTQGGTLAQYLSTHLNRFTTNGQLEPQLAMNLGQMYRFRMVNAGGSDTLELHIVDELNQPACSIREIAIDGLYLDTPREMHDSQSLLVPATRVDWLVICNSAGTYYLRSTDMNTHRLSIGGMTRFNGIMVKLLVSGTAVSPEQNFPTTLPTRPDFVKDLRSVAQDDIGGRFVVELNPSTHLNRELWASPPVYRYKMEVGSTQEWYLLNVDTAASHPLHIHVNHFQVISYNAYTGGYGSGGGQNWELFDVLNTSTSCAHQRAGFTPAARKRRSLEKDDDERDSHKRVKRQGGPPPQTAEPNLEFLGHESRYAADDGNTLGYSRVGEWKDVILVPPLANITIRFVAHEHVGDVVIHCHILAHEDSGMMMLTQIVSQGESTSANVQSGTAYPGTCRECDRYPFNSQTTLCETSNNGSSPKPTNQITIFLNILNIVIGIFIFGRST